MKRLIRTLSIALALALILSSCSGGKPVRDPVEGNGRVFYQIFVGSFSDSDGDGMGDLRGIIDRLDYLNDGDINSGNDLGVQGIWLSPIFQSPSYHKYDATDYYAVDDAFGTEEDLKELADKCDERNVKLILDLALNHTSTRCEWFRDFTVAHHTGDAANPYYDFYSWSKEGEQDMHCAWQPIPGVEGEYYECNFSVEMPELNYDNPLVREEMLKVAKHYLELGVDGFRFDAIKYVYITSMAKNVEFWSWYMDELRKLEPEVYCVGECWSATNDVLGYYPAMNCFNFDMSQVNGVIAKTAKGGSIDAFTSAIVDYDDSVHKANPDGMPVLFIANHDTDRCAGYLTVSNGLAHMAANLYLLSPGSSFIYYGEEIGLKGSRGGASTDANRRLAMLWGDGDKVRDPEGADYDPSAQTNGTVKEQLDDKASLLNRYRELIALRVKYPAIASGDYTALTFDGKAGGFLVNYNGSTMAIIHNTTAEAVAVDLSGVPNAALKKIAASVGEKATISGTTLTIPAYTSVIVN